MVIYQEGEEWEKLYARLNTVNRYLSHCQKWVVYFSVSNMRTNWLVASDNWVNNRNVLHRLDTMLIDKILTHNEWPTLLQSYNKLLSIGKIKMGGPKFYAPYDAYALQMAVQQLKREQPDITYAEMAYLFNIKTSQVRFLCINFSIITRYLKRYLLITGIVRLLRLFIWLYSMH